MSAIAGEWQMELRWHSYFPAKFQKRAGEQPVDLSFAPFRETRDQIWAEIAGVEEGLWRMRASVCLFWYAKLKASVWSVFTSGITVPS